MSNYNDLSATIQVIGGIYTNPGLLELEDKYTFCEEDFSEEFHKILFGSMYNLHAMGAKEITLNAIEDYLEQRPKKYAVYTANKGSEYLNELTKHCQISTFDYYYHRMKKMTLLRMFHKTAGMDLSWLYDPDNILDVKKKQQQEDWLDNTPIEKIAELINSKIDEVISKFVDNDKGKSHQAGDGALELLEKLKENPEVGYPMFGPLVNTIYRGARLKKFYLRSAATGVGKTRAMIADACTFACPQRYDKNVNKWIDIGESQPTVYITTEQSLDEIQTMIIAFLADVNEENICTGKYFAGEWDRVVKASKILKESPLYIEELPDFSLQDIENTIKRNIREHDALYICLDYIHTSMKILEEITRRSGGVKIREDNVLFMMAIRLKDICNEYGVFIESATQLNGDYVDTNNYDQNLLRGAKAIADKIDAGSIMLEVTDKDKQCLEPVIRSGKYEMPSIKISVYKNRRGRWKDLWLWCKEDRGTCKIIPMFATKYNFELLDIPETEINFKK